MRVCVVDLLVVLVSLFSNARARARLIRNTPKLLIDCFNLSLCHSPAPFAPLLSPLPPETLARCSLAGPFFEPISFVFPHDSIEFRRFQCLHTFFSLRRAAAKQFTFHLAITYMGIIVRLRVYCDSHPSIHIKLTKLIGPPCVRERCRRERVHVCWCLCTLLSISACEWAEMACFIW